MCLRDQVIDHNDGVGGRERRARGLSDNDGGVGRGRGIHDTSKGSDTTTGVAGARRRARGIYDNNRGIGRVI